MSLSPGEVHYESFKKTKTICEKFYDYCNPSSDETQPPPPPRLKRTRRIYKRKERSNPKGEICITVYKEKEHHE
jgi:hypothetical protein